MSKFRNAVLLYRPSVSIWTARKKDKEESAKVVEDNNAVAGSATVYKDLLPDHPLLEKLRKGGTNFRDFIYMNTAPWDDGGWRAGRVDRHMEFMAKAGDMMREQDTLCDEFEDVYASAREQARFQLAGLFKERDYPTPQEVRAKFAMSVSVQPVPNADDFRIYDGLPPDEVDKLVETARTVEADRYATATAKAQEQLLDVVTKMATQLEAFGSGKIKKFNDTLVGNINELIDAMPALNITGDPRLDALAKQAKELTMYALVDLRKDKGVRDAAITEAKALAKQIAPEARAPEVTTVSRAPSDAAALFADMLEVQ